VDFPVTFLVNFATELEDSDTYVPEIEKWTVVQGFQAIITKGVLHSLYLKAYSGCRDIEELNRLDLEFRRLKKAVHELLELKTKPPKTSRVLVDLTERYVPVLGGLAKYLFFGLYHNNGLRRIFREFIAAWPAMRQNALRPNNGKVVIHVDGEVYMRVTQLDQILRFLTDTLGFGSFTLTYTPLWSYFEYLLESRITFTRKEIRRLEDKLSYPEENTDKKKVPALIREKKKVIRETARTVSHLRNILAGPLYRAAGLEMPHDMKKIITEAGPVLPTFKPCGELVPYVGEAISRLNEGADLVLNVAPEGCMVASMGTILGDKMLQSVTSGEGLIQHLFSTEGELNEELLSLSLLKSLGPEGFYSAGSLY
jgi:hypothetical protein